MTTSYDAETGLSGSTASGPHQPQRNRLLIYTITGLCGVALLLFMVLGFNRASTSSAAKDKAGQLTSKLKAAGLPAPSMNQITRTLGTDGGPICADPGAALNTAQRAALSNGAAGPGQRPIIADRDVITGAILAISVYCPDKLAAFNDYTRGLKLSDTVKN